MTPHLIPTPLPPRLRERRPRSNADSGLLTKAWQPADACTLRRARIDRRLVASISMLRDALGNPVGTMVPTGGITRACLRRPRRAINKVWRPRNPRLVESERSIDNDNGTEHTGGDTRTRKDRCLL